MTKKRKSWILVTIHFSMPTEKMSEFDKKEPLDILAHQYDLVCNGYELSSGAIRNHVPEYLFKVFGRVGYSKEMVKKILKE